MDIENQDKSKVEDSPQEARTSVCFPLLFAQGEAGGEGSPRVRRDGIPGLEQILLDLNGRNPQPWSPRTLLEFLTSEHNEENFYFFEEVEGLKAVRGLRQQAPPDELCVIPKASKESEAKYLASILETFVKEGAVLQINISHDQRKSVLSLDEKAIQEAQDEVKHLMLRDAFPRFINRVTSQNMSTSFADQRKLRGVIMLLLTTLAVGLMLGFHVPRYYLLITWFGWFLGLVGCFSGFTKVCPMCATRSVFSLDGQEEEIVLACPIARGMLRRRALKYLFVCIGLATLLAVGSFVLTYIIEAANGGTNIYA